MAEEKQEGGLFPPPGGKIGLTYIFSSYLYFMDRGSMDHSHIDQGLQSLGPSAFHHEN